MGFISDQTVTIYQTGMLFLFYRLDRTVLKSHEIHPGIPAEMFTVSHGGDKPAVSHTLAASGFVTGFQTDHQTLGQDMPGIGTVLFFLIIKSEMILDGRIKSITPSSPLLERTRLVQTGFFGFQVVATPRQFRRDPCILIEKRHGSGLENIMTQCLIGENILIAAKDPNKDIIRTIVTVKISLHRHHLFLLLLVADSHEQTQPGSGRPVT